MAKLIKHIALVSESKLVSNGDLLIVAAALQKQATRDVAPIWEIAATVDAFDSLEDVPLDYWPMIVQDNIGYDAAGIHLDESKQPYALISSSASRDVWSLTASHEALEMLVDPFGDRLVAGDSAKSGQGRVNFLVEVCDPSEAADFAYSINSVLVSDFYTPHFFDPVPAAGVRYSYTGSIRKPRTVLKGGYLSWVVVETNEWWQERWFQGKKPTFKKLGKFDGSASIRSQVDRVTWEYTAKAIEGGRQRASLAGKPLDKTRSAGVARANALRSHIDRMVGKG